MRAYTDYPILALGDKSGAIAPIRPCRVVAYDRNKYATVLVGGHVVEIKAGYLYKNATRVDSPDKQPIPLADLERLPESRVIWSVRGRQCDEQPCGRSHEHDHERANREQFGLADYY
jgi:hypothetical protein